MRAVRCGADVLNGCRIQTKCHQGTRSHGTVPIGLWRVSRQRNEAASSERRECGEIENVSSSSVASQNLLDRVNRSFRSPIATRYRDQAIQERVLRVPRLETGRRPEVVGGGIDAFAARERRDHVRRAVTKPERRHVDQAAVVGFQRHAQVEFEDAVSSEERPVTAAGQHLSAEPRTFEVTTRYWGGHASTVSPWADLQYGADCDLQRHQQSEIHVYLSSAPTANRVAVPDTGTRPADRYALRLYLPSPFRS